MKNYFQKIKNQSWQKTLAGLIQGGTIGLAVLVLSFGFLFAMFLGACALWHAYKSSPTAFHYLFGFLIVIGGWMWAWNWSERQ